MIPRAFFVTAGSAQGDDPFELIDTAYHRAGIGHCNLVPVSSILPAGIKQIERASIPPGQITFCVLAQVVGCSNNTITAGLAWGFLGDYGIIAEYCSTKGGEATAKKKLEQRVRWMAKTRGSKVELAGERIETVKVKRPHGCAVVALVFVQ